MFYNTGYAMWGKVHNNIQLINRSNMLKIECYILWTCVYKGLYEIKKDS